MGTSRKPKKTKLEKSLEMLCDSFKEATEMEMQQEEKKKKRHKREMEIQSKLRQLEMERRREERQHELSVLQLLPRQAPMAAFLVSQNFSQSYQNDGFGFSAPSNRSSVDTSSSSCNFDETPSYLQL